MKTNEEIRKSGRVVIRREVRAAHSGEGFIREREGLVVVWSVDRDGKFEFDHVSISYRDKRPTDRDIRVAAEIFFNEDDSWDVYTGITKPYVIHLYGKERKR